MKNMSLKSKVISGVVIASMMVSTGTIAFAADATGTSNAKTSVHNQDKHRFGQGKNNGIESKLNALVTSGTITAEQETAIKTAIMPQGFAKGGNHSEIFKTKLEELVTAGTITADDKTAIETALTSDKGNFKTVLANLVTAGTITAEKQTAIETALKPQKEAKGEKIGRAHV